MKMTKNLKLIYFKRITKKTKQFLKSTSENDFAVYIFNYLTIPSQQDHLL
jgi:hypothetical protein